MLVALNTQLWKTPIDDESARQNAWLEKAMLKASGFGKPIVVFGHHPLFLIEPQEKEEYFNSPLEIRRHLLRLFKDNGVVAYLSGHTHRNVINAYKGIQLVTSATTSRNFDGASMGFRLWQVRAPKLYQHEYVRIRGAKPPPPPKQSRTTSTTAS